MDDTRCPTDDKGKKHRKGRHWKKHKSVMSNYKNEHMKTLSFRFRKIKSGLLHNSWFANFQRQLLLKFIAETYLCAVARTRQTPRKETCKLLGTPHQPRPPGWHILALTTQRHDVGVLRNVYVSAQGQGSFSTRPEVVRVVEYRAWHGGQAECANRYRRHKIANGNWSLNFVSSWNRTYSGSRL